MDEDLKGFVVHEGDEVEIGEANEDMYMKHAEDMRQLDREEN